MDESKTCSKCGESKSRQDFYKDKKVKSGMSSWCKVCIKVRYTDNATRVSEVSRTRHLRVSYGITDEEYEHLLALQENSCALCRKPCTSGKRLSVDHDHDTGYIRGLLCYLCNKNKVGSLTEDNINPIFDYLKNPPADKAFGGKRKVPDGMEKPRKRRRKRRVIKRSSTKIPRS